MCCTCRAQPNPEHQNPEQPLTIAPGRPEGWRPCPRCRLDIIILDDGSRVLQSYCPDCDSGSSEGESDACSAWSSLFKALMSAGADWIGVDSRQSWPVGPLELSWEAYCPCAVTGSGKHLEKTKQTGRRQTMTDDRRQNTTDNPVRCLGILLLTQYKFKD